MIYGHGIDILDVSRIKKAIEDSARFLNKLFTENEISYCKSKRNKYQSFAARFVAKEAFLKALGTGWSHGIAWTEIEVNKDPQGKPFIILSGKAKELFDKCGCTSIHLSLSHTSKLAMASVIIETL